MGPDAHGGGAGVRLRLANGILVAALPGAGVIELRPGETAWTGYGEDNSYDADASARKAAFVRAATGRRRARLAWDIGCNDGSLLRSFGRAGVRTLGVDPAANLAALAPETQIPRFIGFFNAANAQAIVAQHGRASLVTATNTFPHIPLLDDFVAGIDTVLAPGGAFVIEVHYLLDLIDH